MATVFAVGVTVLCAETNGLYYLAKLKDAKSSGGQGARVSP